MPIIYLDAVGGIAGDMFVAAMLDALPQLTERVMTDVRAVLPPEAGVAQLTQERSGAFRVARFATAPPGEAADDHRHARHAGDDHGPHRHASADRAGDTSFSGMVARIEAAPLASGTAPHAIAILTILAEAEAGIHGVEPAQVHFHELADWDSLADVVAAGSIAAALPDARWGVSDLPRGGGQVRTQHGLLPVPAPATVAILTGFRWRDDGVSGERVTPTGAAILRHLVATADVAAAGKLLASGTGAGTRELAGVPNILRALVFDEDAGAADSRVAVVCFDIDDMSGEEIGSAADRLRGCDGVLDVSVGQRIGKKGRPVHAFRLLGLPAVLERIQDACMRETSTIGLRWRIESRVVLARASAAVTVRDNRVRVKSVARPDGVTTAKAESDDLDEAGSLAERRAIKAAAEEPAGS
jgi:uncharacterized protein (TIGR00299 family) protein